MVSTDHYGHRVTSAQGRTKIAFTEWLILTALLFTFLIANGELVGLKLQQSFLKHIVGVAIVASCLFDYIGRRLFTSKATRRKGSSLIYWAPLLTLAVFITAGSLYARFSLKIEDTFLIVGLYIFVGWVFSLALQQGNVERLLSVVFWVTLAFSCAVCISTIVSRALNFRVLDTAIHEREFFVIPLLYLLFFTDRVNGLPRWICIGLIFGAAIAAMKNTPTLVLSLTLLMSFWRGRVGRSNKKVVSAPNVAFTYFGVVASVVLILGAIAYISYVQEITPVGNVNFRQHQYTAAWNEFLKSPVVGSGFTSGTGIDFNLRNDVSLLSSLPTHNDVLDILRAGGAIGFALWLFPLIVVFGRTAALLQRQASIHHWNDEHDFVGWLLLCNISAVIVYSFNPLLAKTAFASIVWIFGALLATLVTTSSDKESND